jgi:voltage-gated potassium channel
VPNFLERSIERSLTRFLRKPPSVRNAVSVIVAGTAAVTGLAALLMRIIDRAEYPNIWRALWWSVQTVSTVGYGDVTPARTSGRIVAAALMLWGVAFLAVLTAAITSVFVSRAAQTMSHEHETKLALDTVAARLDRIEQLLAEPKHD